MNQQNYNTKNNANSATYTITLPCTPITQLGYDCPVGWETAGYTHQGSCAIGNVPGSGHEDLWKQLGWQKVCKKKIETTGNIELDCCGNKDGVANSIECQARGLSPYNQSCDVIMKNHCTTRNNIDPYSHNWNGVPKGQNGPVYNGCSQRVLQKQGPKPYCGCKECQDCKLCFDYLRFAPPNNYFATHNFNEYHHEYPHYSYTTPDFNNAEGYYPMRKPYYPYNDQRNELYNNVNAHYPTVNRYQ